MRLITLGLAASISLALASCGGDTKTVTVGAATPQTAAAPPTPATTTSPSKSESKRIAKAALLRLSDLPTGWEEQDDNGDDPEAEDGKCKAVEISRDAADARDNTNTFTKDNSYLTANALVYPDEAAAEKAFEGFVSAESRRCTAEVVGDQSKKVARDGAEVGTPKSSVVSTTPLGDDTEAIRVALPVTYLGSSDDLPFDLTYTRIGRGIVITTAQNVTDDDLRNDIITAAARRLKDATDAE